MIRTLGSRGLRAPALPWVLLVLAAGAPGCDDAPPPGPVVAPRPEWTPERTSAADALATRLAGLPDRDGVVVRLAFGPEADLDLYVTGPLEETVYFANTPSRIGGELVEDQRCTHAPGEDPGTRIEEARFPSVPGRYRVGVDYPRACGESRAPAPFALRLDAPGGPRAHRAIAVHQVFEPIVLEFEVESQVESQVESHVEREVKSGAEEADEVEAPADPEESR